MDHKYNALIGDKILGAAAALALCSDDGAAKGATEPSAGVAPSQLSIALSGKLLAESVGITLPDVTKHAEPLSESGAGSMAQAAAAAVHESDKEAVQGLAGWLLEEAQGAQCNYKGLLLELGGAAPSSRVGGSDHLAIFKAAAALDG